MSESLRRQISSPSALFTFEAVARLGGFSAAALELNVTQPSVSYQIKNLENHLGLRLFERRGRGVDLTEDGETLSRAIERGFATIQIGLAEIARRSSLNLVTLCVSSSAAAHLLLPRYPNLRRTLPELDLSLKIMSRDINPAAENADFAIRLGDGQWQGLRAWRLFDEVYFPLCAPGFFAGDPADVTLDALKSCNLLYLKERHRARDDWSVFFERFGAPIGQAHARMTFSDQQTLLEAAIGGQGVGLGWFGMTDHLLATGVLVKPTVFETKTERAFYLVAPDTARLSGTALAFRDWILAEGRDIQARREQAAIGPPDP